MANTFRSGADGGAIMLGRQATYGTALTQNSDMIAKRYPIVSNTYQLRSNNVEGRSISALGADTPNEIGKFWAEGDIAVEVFSDNFIEFLRGIMNPNISANATAITVASADQPLGTAVALNHSTVTTFAKNVAMVQDSRSTTAKYALPCKLRVTLAGGTYASGAKVTLTGNKADGVDADVPGNRVFTQEEIPFTANGNKLSSNFFADVTNIEFTGITPDSATVQLEWVPAAYFLQLKLQATDPMFPGWMLMMIKGGVPVIGMDAIPNQMTISADEDGITATFATLGGPLQQYRTVAGGFNAERLELAAADNTYFVAFDADPMLGWAGRMRYDDIVLTYNSLDLVFNRQLEFQGGVDGNRFRRNPLPTGNRQLTFTPRIPFESGDQASDVFNRWQDIYRADERKPFDLTMRRYGSDGRESRIEIESAASQMTSSPGIPVDGQGPIELPLEFKGLSTSSESSEIVVNIIQQTQYTI